MIDGPQYTVVPPSRMFWLYKWGGLLFGWGCIYIVRCDLASVSSTCLTGQLLAPPPPEGLYNRVTTVYKVLKEL